MLLLGSLIHLLFFVKSLLNPCLFWLQRYVSLSLLAAVSLLLDEENQTFLCKKVHNGYVEIYVAKIL